MLDTVYPSTTRAIWALLGSSIFLLLLGGLIWTYGEAHLVGLIIAELSVLALASIMAGTAMLSIVNRAALRKRVVAVHRSVVFVDECGYPDMEPMRRVIRQDVMPTLDTLAIRINRSIAKHDFPESYRTSNLLFDKLIICRIKRRGSVILRWGKLRRVVSGLAYGNVVEVEWRPMYLETFGPLVQHEMGHLLLDQGTSRHYTHNQHLVLKTLGL